MKLLAILALLAASASISAQTAPPHPALVWKPLAFLEGTWSATTQPGAAVSTSGLYTFRTELDRHILARHSTSDPGCKAPASFDCKHGDLLYVFPGAPGQPLQAIYFDSEGHVLHYTVSTPTPTSAVFLSQPGPGPQFRLVYTLDGKVMSGKFQVLPPGQTAWQSYLEWSGTRQ